MKRLLLCALLALSPVPASAQDLGLNYAQSLQNTINFLQAQLDALAVKIQALLAEMAALPTGDPNPPPPPPPPPSGTTVTASFYPRLDARVHCSSSPVWGTNGSFMAVRDAAICGPHYLIEDADGDGYHQKTGGAPVNFASVDTENNGSNYFHIYRFFLEFDTSSIPVGATIDSAVMTLDGAPWVYNGNNSSIGLYVSTANLAQYIGVPNNYESVPSLVSSDWSACGASLIAPPIAFTNWSVSGDNPFAFNTQGKLLLPASTVKVCLKTSHDADGIAPSGVNEVYFYTMEHTDPTKWPKLTVTYTY